MKKLLFAVLGTCMLTAVSAQQDLDEEHHDETVTPLVFSFFVAPTTTYCFKRTLVNSDIHQPDKLYLGFRAGAIFKGPANAYQRCTMSWSLGFFREHNVFSVMPTLKDQELLSSPCHRDKSNLTGICLGLSSGLSNGLCISLTGKAGYYGHSPHGCMRTDMLGGSGGFMVSYPILIKCTGKNLAFVCEPSVAIEDYECQGAIEVGCSLSYAAFVKKN